MFVKYWQFLTIVLTALLMGTAFGHALEMPMKLRVPGPVWLTFQHTLYAAFAFVGAPIELGSIVSASVLAYYVRRDRDKFCLSLLAAILLAVAFFGIWVGLINPVNARTATWTAETIPLDWTHWRAQWEYSHLVRFILQLLAFCALLSSAFPRSASEVRVPKGIANRSRIAIVQ